MGEKVSEFSRDSMLKVKLSSSDNIDGLLAQTPGGKGVWGNCEFFVDEDISECDYWIVLNELSKKETVICPPGNTIFVTGEPVSVKKYSGRFLSQFATVITAQDSLHHQHVIKTHQILPWFVNKKYDELNDMSFLEKSKNISIVSSNKRFSKGHESRYQYAMALKNYFGDNIDLFGRGIRDFGDKWDVLAPYKYSVVIENSSSNNYITEKLDDCFLSYTFPFYYGCTNLEDYYPKDSFAYIDITDLDGSIDVIEKTLADSQHYALHFEALCEARKRYLQQYQLFPSLVSIISSLQSVEKCPPKKMTLFPSSVTMSDLSFMVRCLFGMGKNLFG